jgi:hypothetical protein
MQKCKKLSVIGYYYLLLLVLVHNLCSISYNVFVEKIPKLTITDNHEAIEPVSHFGTIYHVRGDAKLYTEDKKCPSLSFDALNAVIFLRRLL